MIPKFASILVWHCGSSVTALAKQACSHLLKGMSAEKILTSCQVTVLFFFCLVIPLGKGMHPMLIKSVITI